MYWLDYNSGIYEHAVYIYGAHMQAGRKHAVGYMRSTVTIVHSQSDGWWYAVHRHSTQGGNTQYIQSDYIHAKCMHSTHYANHITFLLHTKWHTISVAHTGW